MIIYPISKWVTQFEAERLKGAKDEVKQPRKANSQKSGLELPGAPQDFVCH